MLRLATHTHTHTHTHRMQFQCRNTPAGLFTCIQGLISEEASEEPKHYNHPQESMKLRFCQMDNEVQGIN
jgi:hypothetical protein